MRLAFAKMQGLGNDFVVFDATERPLALDAAQLRQIADRRLGIGCDQILIAEPATRPDADFFYRMYNSDGSEAGQCGNGARCMALFLQQRGLTDKPRIRVQTIGGLMTLERAGDGFRVDMGVPEFEPANIPLAARQQAPSYELPLTLPDGRDAVADVQALSLGNPHAVLTVDDVGTAPVAEWGPLIESHAAFPERVNAGFMQVIDASTIALRVYERGAGETRACGSGACAAAVAARLRHGLEARIEVRLAGGALQVEWAGEGQPVMQSGPATHVFSGEICLSSPAVHAA